MEKVRKYKVHVYHGDQIDEFKFKGILETVNSGQKYYIFKEEDGKTIKGYFPINRTSIVENKLFG